MPLGLTLLCHWAFSPDKESEESVANKPEFFRKAGPQSPPWPGEEAEPSGHLGNRKYEPWPTSPPGRTKRWPW